jgi:hypothetical protein
MGTQDKIRSKAEEYRQLYHQTKQMFHVLFLVQTDKQLASAQQDLQGFTEHYQCQLHSLYCSDTLSLSLEQSKPATSIDDDL